MNTKSTLSEKALVANCVNRNRKSQKELFERFAPEMFAICLKGTKSNVDAEEILQNGFVKVFDNIQEFRGEESLGEWVTKVFVGLLSKYAKQNRSKVDIQPVFKNMVTTEHLHVLDDLYETIYSKTSSKYNKNYETVFKLYAVTGYPVKETVDKPGALDNYFGKQSTSPGSIEDNASVKSQSSGLTYIIQKGDHRRMDKNGVIRVYNLNEPIEIPVRKLLGKWKKEHIGLTLTFKNNNWQLKDGAIERPIYKAPEPAIGFRRLLKFV